MLLDLSVPVETLRNLYLNPTIQSSIINGPLNEHHVLITGGAGFVGSHLVDRCMLLGARVTVIDDLSTGSVTNIRHWMENPRFRFIEADIRDYNQDSDAYSVIFHLASPASPPHYQSDPLKTLFTNINGTKNMLDLALKCNACFVLASTSEVYGDPLEHPQPESYFGNVNTTGPRACYDEGKRVAETICSLYHSIHKVRTRILRIFNTFGPRMQPDDGRVVSNFIVQHLHRQPLLIHGDGAQTRSFQFIHDLIEAFMLAAFLYVDMPDEGLLVVNVGCPDERTIDEFAGIIGEMMAGEVALEWGPKAVDDPRRRRPDITKAMKLLHWKPKWSLEDGLRETIDYFKLWFNSS